MVQWISCSFSMGTEISPVTAPLGFSHTFCAATAISGLSSQRVWRRRMAGGATMTSMGIVSFNRTVLLARNGGIDGRYHCQRRTDVGIELGAVQQLHNVG